MILVSGYNGFHQLLALFQNKSKVLYEHTVTKFCPLDVQTKDVILRAGWNEILFVENNNIKICGFYNSESGQCISLTPPFKERIIEAAICKDGYIFVSDVGKVWRYYQQDNIWKDVSSIFSGEISESDSNKIIKVICGETLMAAISNCGVAYCGPNILSEVNGVRDISCGKEHGILLTDSGIVYTWGGGSRGQLGRGDLESCESPSEVGALSGLRVVKVSAGGWHSAVITDQGDLYTWGWNKQGQLGFPLLSENGDEESVSVQVLPRAVVLSLDDAFIEDVSCGTSHTVIKLRDGTIYGCGWNKWGQLGLGGVRQRDRLTPLPLPPDFSPSKLLCGAWTTFILS